MKAMTHGAPDSRPLKDLYLPARLAKQQGKGRPTLYIFTAWYRRRNGTLTAWILRDLDRPRDRQTIYLDAESKAATDIHKVYAAGGCRRREAGKPPIVRRKKGKKASSEIAEG
jgi:hypothetical protein